MTRNFYGNRMFVADLTLVTLWAIFAAKYLIGFGEVLFLLPLMRIALSFQMRSRSPWTLVSAVAFGCFYAGVEDSAQPIEGMTHILGAVLHLDSLTRPVDGVPIPVGYTLVSVALRVLVAVWLVAMPIAVALLFKNVQAINWRTRWVRLYCIAAVLLGAWGIYEEGSTGLAPFGLLLAPLPAIYWIIYHRKGRSVAQLLVGRRDVVWYTAFLAYYSIALTIGLRGIESWKVIALLSFPPLLYVMLVKVMRLGKVLTRICVALAAAGWCYTASLHFEVPYVMTVGAVGLCVYAGGEAFRTTKSKLPGILLALGVPVVVAPSILGLNPYVAMDAVATYGAESNGVYVIKCNMKTPGKLLGKMLPYCGYGYGLRDRYGVVLPMKYKELEILGTDNGGFAKVKTYGFTSPNAFGIYDIEHNQWIINPHKGTVRNIVMAGDGRCALYDARENHFATVLLPGYHGGNYYRKAEFVPHFSSSEVSAEEFLKVISAVDPIPDGYRRKCARNANPDAYRLTAQMLIIDKVYPSPRNNLHFARAVKQLVTDSPRYKGNMHRAMAEVAEVCRTGSESGSYADADQYYEHLRLLRFVEFVQKYDQILSAFPHNELIYGEYEAWNNLIKAMTVRLDDMYDLSGHYDAEQANKGKMRWFEVREALLPTELAILTAKSSYTLPAAEAAKLSTDKDFEALFATFAPYPSQPDYEDTMYTEVRPAFNHWRAAREALANSLPAAQARSYREYTRVATHAIFQTVRGLDWPGFRPVR